MVVFRSGMGLMASFFAIPDQQRCLFRLNRTFPRRWGTSALPRIYRAAWTHRGGNSRGGTHLLEAFASGAQVLVAQALSLDPAAGHWRALSRDASVLTTRIGATRRMGQWDGVAVT